MSRESRRRRFGARSAVRGPRWLDAPSIDVAVEPRGDYVDPRLPRSAPDVNHTSWTRARWA